MYGESEPYIDTLTSSTTEFMNICVVQTIMTANINTYMWHCSCHLLDIMTMQGTA